MSKLPRTLYPSKLWERVIKPKHSHHIRTMGLESLPDELLCEIFELLSYEEGPSTEDDPDDLESDSTYRAPQELLSLLRCSHRTYRIPSTVRIWEL